MVAIFVGSGAGVARSSGNLLGGAGVLGSAVQGRGGEGVSVNAATGNLILTQQDEFLAGRGPDAAIIRTYNSLAEAGDGDNGDQWQMGSTRRVLNLRGTLNSTGSTVQRLGGDGALITYSYGTRDGITAYWSTDGDGAHDKLVKSGANWVWTDGSSQFTETYEASVGDAAAFRIKALADTDGNAIDYRYLAGTDKVEYVVTANHNNANAATGVSEVSYVYYSWSGNNLSSIVTGYTDYGSAATEADNVNKQRTRTRYSYDAQNRLIQVTVDQTPNDNSIADNKTYVTTYTYDGSSKRVTSITQSDGSSVTITYDASGRVATLTQAVAAGDTRVTSLAYGANFTNVTGPDGQVTRLDYAGGSLVPQSILEWDSDPIYVTKEAAGSIAGEVAGKFTSAVGATWSGVSRGVGAVAAGDTLTYGISLKAVAGSATEQSLGLYGSVSNWGSGGSTARIVSGPGQLVQHGGGFWEVTGLSATEETRIEITRTFTQAETAAAYFYVDHPGGYRDGQQVIAGGAWVTKNSVPDGAFRQLTKITAPPAYAGAAAQVVQFGYDSAGNLTTMVDAAGKTTTFTYDADGNLLTSTDPNGSAVTRTYGTKNELLTETRTGSDAGGAAIVHTTRYVYDSESHLRFAISAEGNVVRYDYTAAGQNYWRVEFPQSRYDLTGLASNQTPTEAQMIAWTETVAGPSATNRKTVKIVHSDFDARGNVTVVRQHSIADDWAHTNLNEGYQVDYFTYDQAGRLLSQNKSGETAQSFVYDGLGRITASTDTAGGTTTFVFNDAALTTTVTTATGFTSVKSYNKAGDLVGEANSGSFDPNGTTTYLYDKNGRARVAIDATGYKSFFLYDKAGRKVADVNAYGQVVEYRYDAANRVTATTSFYNVLSAANLAALDNANNSLEMAGIRPAEHASDVWSWTVYDAGGRAVQAIDGDGGVVAFEYDASNRLVKTTSYFNKVAVAALKTTPPAAAVAVTAHTKDTLSRSFYDRDGRLIGTLDGEGYLTETVYDKAGQKVEEIAYSTKTNASYWAAGTFDQLRSTAAPAATTNRRLRYVLDAQGLVRYTVDAAGRVTGYSYNTAGKLTQTRVYAAVISTSDFTYLTVKSLAVANAANDRVSTISYNAPSLVASTVDAGGLATAFTYNAAGRVTKMVVGSGGSARTTYHYYTAAGDLRFTVDPEGYVRRFDYDAEGRQTREVVWDTPISVSDATTIAQVNSLAAGNWTDRRTEYDPAGRVSSTYDGAGTRTHYSYYGTGQLAGIYHAYGTADQSLTYHGYDGAGRLVSEYFAYGEPEQAIVQYAYDGLGNRTSVTDARGNITTYSYDEVGQVLTATNPGGGVNSYVYNAFGDVVQATDPRGAVTANIYNNLGQLTRMTDALGVATDYSYTAFGDLASVVRAGATTSFQHDKLGRVTRATDALGYFESYTYDAFGDRTQFTNKLGGVTQYTYDRKSQLRYEWVDTKAYDAAGNVSANGFYKNIYEYDARGNISRRVEAYNLAEQRITLFAYDKNNRLIETTGPAFLGMTPRSTITYDARGNVTSSVDPAGARTVNYYDDLNRVTVSIDPVGTYSTRSYDKNGNITSARVYATPVPVPADGGSEEEAPAAPGGSYRETTSVYDTLDRLTSSSIAGVKTGSFNGSAWVSETTAITTSFVYDAAGNVVKGIDANGNTIWNYYDALGRKTNQIDGEGYRTDWTYNADGNVTSERRYWNRAAAPSGTTTPPAVTIDAGRDRITDYSYDLNGNRLSEARQGVQIHNGSGGYATVTATIAYLYNAMGQVTRKTEATGDQVNYTYDGSGRLMVEMRQAFVDQSGASVTPTVDYFYDAAGNLSRTRQRGSANAAERVTTYGYDGGKLRWMTDAEAQDGDVKNGLTTYYAYDVAGRQTHQYYQRYDSAGALTKTVAGATASYEGFVTAYDAAGRVTQKWQATYDTTNGWVDHGPRAVTSYNAFGEVASVAVGGVTQQQNQYDTAGRLVATNSGDGVWKHFGYDKNGSQTVAITSAGANLSGKTFDQAFAMIGQADVNATYTRYDKRNMALSVTETARQLAIGGAAQTLTTSRAYTAFGDVASETNALGATIDYSYNTMGRLIKSESPTVNITLENGTVTSVRPTEQYYHDAAGRVVATRDANTNLTRLTLLSGSGYGGAEALVTAETHADGGVKQVKYDIHGDAREMVDELGRRTLQTFDAKGRITVRQELRNAASTYDDFYDYYYYDGLGQQLKHWNNALQTPIYGDPVWVEDPYPGGPPYYYPEIPGEPGSGYGHWETPIIGYTPDVETTDYDIQGRITYQRAFGGDVTTTAYVWDAAMATAGLGTFGGWSQTTTMANGLYSVEKSDLFGHVTYKRDLGAHVTSYTYDVAGRIANSSLGGLTTSFTWLNSGFLGRLAVGSPNAGSQTSSWTRDTATYGYDRVGNRLTEQFAREYGTYDPGGWIYYNPYEPEYIEPSYYEWSELIKNQTATYDALGRLTAWTESGTAKSPAASIANEYDAAGNVRRTLSTYRTLDAGGTASSTAMTRDYWFRYDSMNRVVVNQGSLSNGVISRGFQVYGLSGSGQDITYNVAGQRTSVATTNAYFDGYGGYTANEVKELYYYDEAGRLIEAREATGAVVSGGYGGDPGVPAATGTGVKRSAYSYDLMGRQYLQQDYAANGTTVVFSRSAAYNAKGQLTSDYTSNLKTDNKTYTSSTTYNYGAGTGYMLGAVVSQSSSNGMTGQSTTYSSTTNSYIWYDGALQSTISYKPNTSQSTTYTTSFAYNGMGQLVSAYINDGKPHSVTFTNDELGQIIRRDETAVSGQTGAPHEVWYRFSGRQLGYSGNNGTNDMSMGASISDRQVVSPSNQGTFRNKQMYGSSYADFAQNYDPINSFSQGSAGGSYSVQRGDTLQSIAQSVWGDASLWYKIAEANGLSAASGLIEGQRLTLPTGVLKSSHNASTLNPYDPSEAIGDLSPTTAPKPKKPKCGGFGMILLAVIAIAVATVVTAGAASALTGASFSNALGAVFSGSLVGFGTSTTVLTTVGAVGAIATGAVAGSIVSQAIGVATGVQEKFSWKSVALAGIGSLVGGGITGIFGKAGNALGAAAQAAAGSAITQGIGVATGLQDKFSWAGVAAAGVGAAAGHLTSDAITGKKILGQWVHDGSVGQYAVTSAASMVANAATRSAIDGSSFGQNILAALPDVLAGILQRAIGKAAFPVSDVAEEVTRNPTAESDQTVRSWSAAENLDEVQIRSTALTLDDLSLNVDVDPAELELAIAEPEFQSDVVEVGKARVDGGSAREPAIRIVERLGGAQAGQMAREALSFVPEPVEIVVWGERGPRRLGTAPNYLRYAVDFLVGTHNAVEWVNRKIEDEVPFAWLALEALDFAAGPAAYAARKIVMASPLGRVIDDRIGDLARWTSETMRGAGIDPVRAAKAAAGVAFLGGLAFGARRALGFFNEARFALALRLSNPGPGRTRAPYEMRSTPNPGPGMTMPNTTRGWRVGDPINNLTANGRVPSWSAVRARYWKNYATENPAGWSPANLARMRQGLAPQRPNPRTGEIESMELNHVPPQRDGGRFDVERVWPDEHAARDPYRRVRQ